MSDTGLRRWAVEVLTREAMQPMIAKLHPDVRNAIGVLVRHAEAADEAQAKVIARGQGLHDQLEALANTIDEGPVCTCCGDPSCCGCPSKCQRCPLHGEPQYRARAVEHEARTERSDEPTLELPLPSKP